MVALETVENTAEDIELDAEEEELPEVNAVT